MIDNNIVVAIIGKTSNFTINSITEAIPNCKIFHIVSELDRASGPICQLPNSSTILCSEDSNYLNIAFEAARTVNAGFLYIMNGFSILNSKILKDQNIESFCSDSSWYSNYIFFKNYPLRQQEDFFEFGQIKNLTSFDPILINKTTIDIINIFINMSKVNKFEYNTPYEFVVGEYTLGNIVRHISVPLFYIDIDPYENLNNEVKDKYAKLYV
jgi:hypothetical protein